MRRALAVDANQPDIVAALRAVGASVEIIGRPVDLLVGYQGKTWVMEVKDGEKPPSDRAFTEIQAKFFRTWRGGPALKVESIEDALRAIGAGR